ncbi:hypothetical protein Tco_0908827 [Tanacetum coccineum]|uniref:Reverse transcriptase domain-containing protein n=1 Tax=Tanacetum coccineum TaxID=301880 RepID=A0ABQ5CQC8_9ASTR
MGSVLPNAPTARGLVIQPGTAGNGNAMARAYAVGNAGKNPDANVMMGTFLLNNRYASILFDTGTDSSFVSTAFSSFFDIVPSTLDHDYVVELADGKIIRANYLSYRLQLLNFQITNSTFRDQSTYLNEI